MRRILIAGVLPFVSAFLGGALAYPTIVEGQNGRVQLQSLRAEELAVAGVGSDRLKLLTQWDGRGGDINFFAPDGTRRLAIGAGGINVEDPGASGLNIYAKLHVHSKTEAVAKALREGLV